MNKYKCFVSGVLMVSSINSLRQDFMGMEGYIQYVRIGWSSAWVTVPLALIFLLVSLILFISKDHD